MTSAAAQRFPWVRYVVVGVTIILLAILPLLSVLLTYAIADASGCTVNEATVHPCVVLGVDLGGLLYGMGVLGWLLLATLPLGAIFFGAFLVALAIHLFTFFRKGTGGPAQ